MILKIRNSKIGRAASLFMVFVFILTLNPTGGYSLTGGPAQPEFNSFTPIGTSDMVDLASGDFSYNIPLMDIGGFPINLAYSSGVTMDQEASWVGLGWDLSIGQINRQMRGLPDDFDGDEMTYENNIKDNWTVGGTFQASPELFGLGKKKHEGIPMDSIIGVSSPLKLGIAAQYNSYNGFSMTPSLGASFQLSKNVSIGFNASSTPDGLNLSPSMSLSHKVKKGKLKDKTLSSSVGVSFNSRQGLSSVNLSSSVSKKGDKAHPNKQITIGSTGSSKSFVKNTYTPTVQDNMTSVSVTFNAAIDMTTFGFKGEAETSGFLSNQYIANKIDKRRAYGYEHTEKDPNRRGVLDFNREKDGVFSVNSTNLPITNYTYDLYSISGQGVSGMFQPFRSQVGYVYDNYSASNSAGLSLGAEIGGGGNFDLGVDFEVNNHLSESGIWYHKNQALSSFEESPTNNPKYEEVYFKNVGDLSADQDMDMYGNGGYENLGGYQPIRIQLGRVPYARKLKNTYLIKTNDIDPDPEEDYEDEVFFEQEAPMVPSSMKRSERVRRNQTILKVSAKDAGQLAHLSFEPAHALAKAHHTAGFIITRNDGARYNYGKPLYNSVKKEVTFAVGDEVGGTIFSGYGSSGDRSTGLVSYEADEDNSLDNQKGDHYFERVTTPAYAHTYLLTSLLSTDYSDVDGITGPSEGDYGSYTLFNYVNTGNYKWRVPFEANEANYNEGLRTDPTDDKASYIYGEKETSYIQKIETKTHVAIFDISPREDGYGVAGENGGRGITSVMYKLDKIRLYSRGEYYQADGITPIAGATPIKTVHLVYDYSQCEGVPNNRFVDGVGTELDENELSNTGGKLTLKSIYFTYRNSNMGRYSAYNFGYGDKDHNPATENPETNPVYNLKGYDIWGNYKPNSGTENGNTLDPLAAPDYNYVEQNSQTDKDAADNYTGAWSITDISLPSGGNIQVDYETDDYQYVQDQKAMRMFKLAGSGTTANPITDPDSNFDFDADSPLGEENKEGILFKADNPAKYLYFELDEEDQNLALTDEEYNALLRSKYINEIINTQEGLVQFRMFVNMTQEGGKKNSGWKEGSFDYVTGYFEVIRGQCETFNALKDGESRKFGSIRMKLVDMEGGIFSPGTEFGDLTEVNPISKATWQFTRKYLGKYVYGLPNMEEGTAAGVALETIFQSFENLAETVVGPNALLKSKKIGRRFVPEKSWIRLCEPTQNKKGGGCRVKQLAMTDEWATMTGNTPDGIMDQKYGQQYSYELAEGGSSGVATYEPVGCKENPLVQPVFMNVNRTLAPDEENYVEKPFGESFFPNPTITYSRVIVKNLERAEGERSVTKHATGEVITEFYTSKDFPTITDQTRLQAEEDHNPLLSYLFSINVMKHLTLSQGYLIHLNDMNGKMKSQRVYAEGQDQYISGVDYVYDLNSPETAGDATYFDNKGKLNNNVYVMDAEGNIHIKTLGVEYNTINDFRAMESESKIVGVDMQTNAFMIGPLPIIVPTLFPKFSRHVDKLNISSTTKVVNSYGILRKVIAHDAGASVSTRNLLWDEETGEVLLTETVNEYNDRYYSLNFPAHWNYKGMGQASTNSGIVLKFNDIADPDYNASTLVADGNAEQYLFPGDEVIIRSKSGGSLIQEYAWVDKVSTGGNLFNLINKEGESVILDETASLELRIIRSGHRNIQSTSMASIVLQRNPFYFLTVEGSGFKFDTDAYIVAAGGDDWKTRKIVNAGAVEFIDDWLAQCECGIDANDTTINPYVHNQKGVWRANKSYLYLTGRHHKDGSPDPRYDGFYTDFSLFYKLGLDGKWLVPAESYEDWTFTSQVTQFSPYGFEIENEDALGRKSAALYGYNYSFPLAVGANAAYSELAFDGFEDYNFYGCPLNEHFGFRSVMPGDPTDLTDEGITNSKAHTGKFSLKVKHGTSVNQTFNFDCEPQTEN